VSSALALVGVAFAACSSEEDPVGNTAAGSGAGSTAGTLSGSPAASGTNATVGGSTSGASATAGTSTGGGGSSLGGQAGSGNPGVSGNGNGGTSSGSGAGGASGGSSAAAGCSAFTGKFCDDFEGQTEGQAPKGDFSVDGPVTVDTGKAFSGTKSLKITKPNPTGQLHFSSQVPTSDLHGRAMFYVSQVPQQGGPHWDLVVAVADNADNTNWEIGGMYGKFLLIVDPPDTGVEANPFPTGKWFCLQWQYKFAGAGQDHTFVAKVDGTVLQNGMFTGSDAEGHHWDAGPWKNLSIGFTSYGSSVDTDIWVDDLAFGEQEIACPAPK
jgi:hypothetical protein